jgi:hypothetical protein
MSTIKLNNPITTHKGPLTEVTLTEPKARAFVTHGEPFKIKSDGGDKFEVDYMNGPMMGFLVEMTGLDEIVLGGMNARDYMALRVAAFNMIVGIAGSSPTSP